MADLSVKVAGVDFNSPLIAASGTFGFGHEYSNFYDLSNLGGISCKGITLKKRLGNPPPRIAETPSGILNAVGLQNPGVDHFIEKDLPWLKKQGTVIIANIAGNTQEEYGQMAEKLSDTDIDMIELNISCPNVKSGGVAFGTSCESVANITKYVRDHCKKPLIVKLSPNVTDIAEIAKSAEANGADAISMINTLTGMRIDINTGRPIIKNNTGGMSGPPTPKHGTYQSAPEAAFRRNRAPAQKWGWIPRPADPAPRPDPGQTRFFPCQARRTAQSRRPTPPAAQRTRPPLRSARRIP